MSSKAQRIGSDYRRKRKRFHARSIQLEMYQIRLLLTAYLLPLRNCSKKIILTRGIVKLSRRLHEKCCDRRSISFWSNEICVSGDGTWKTRGHTSRIGVCSVIEDVTGKVIDVAVLSSYCKGCGKWRGLKSGHSYEEWKLKHQPHCVKNHIGSSSKMEVDGMKGNISKIRCHTTKCEIY
ncbi:uncharacterized protein TNCV_2911661 [Trichonephila clavipes]|nr:uncharacterized protein TNCV_2911661 [Trichonephila clavipes]